MPLHPRRSAPVRTPTLVPAALAGVLLQTALLAQLPAARLAWLFPAGGSPGSTNTVMLSGTDLDDPRALVFSDRRIVGTPVPGNPAAFAVVVPADVPAGAVDARFVGRFGASAPVTFLVGPKPVVVVPATNTTVAAAAGIDRAHAFHARVVAGNTHWFRFDARKGERLVARAEAARLDSRLAPNLAVFDAAGAELARTRRLGWLDFTAPGDGSFLLQLADDLFRGGDTYGCSITLESGPTLDFAVPCVLRGGTTNRVALFGRNLPGGRATPFHGADGGALQVVDADIPAPMDPDPAVWPADQLERPGQAGVAAWAWQWSATNGISNPLVFGLTAQSVVAAPVPAPGKQRDRLPGGLSEVPVPIDFGGIFPHPGEVSGIAFKARKGDVFQVELVAEGLGQPVDPHAVIQRADGTSKWNDVSEIGDGETNLGGNDFNTASRDGTGRLEVGEDGTYRVLVRDLLHVSRTSPRRPYRLSIHRPSPGFALAAWPAPPPKANNDDRSLHPAGLALRRGQTLGVRVGAFRRDGFAGDIALTCADLPAGVTVATTRLPSGQNSDWLLLSARDDAPEATADVRILGSAGSVAGGKPHAARWGAVKWQVPDFNQEPVAYRLARRTTLAVVAEPAPLTVVAGVAEPMVAVSGSKLSIPITAVRRFDSMAAFSLRVSGHPALEKVPEVKFAEKATNAVLELNLAEFKLPEGTHTLWLQGQAALKYRNQPEAVDRADAALKAAEKAIAAAPADRKAAAEPAKKAAEAAKKAAEERAKPRDVTLTVWSRPFVVRVDPIPKK
ncbi:MAG: hypothetical protein DVB31_06605 [Verrucomicrobia bacterium]|nr:MAG: hypothetical protein DVB31_06605 [Verrucomicrobiota bacterium]